MEREKDSLRLIIEASGVDQQLGRFLGCSLAQPWNITIILVGKSS